jgi:hypothetical protein
MPRRREHLVVFATPAVLYVPKIEGKQQPLWDWFLELDLSVRNCKKFNKV